MSELSASATETDEWSEWLLHRRHADDPAFGHIVRAEVERYADRVLEAARLAPGMVLADIGAGEGVVAFRAIERVGPSLRVVLTDISASLLRHVEMLSIERQVRGQCSFVHCPADRLTGIPNASVDVVTTRAVLAYVADKTAALREFNRILKPGGRISLAEPVLQDDALMAAALRTMIETGTARADDRFLPLLHRWKAAQYPDTPEKIAASPISSYSERNLFDFVRTSGFVEIHLELHIDMLPSIIRSWEVFLDFSPHPWAPTLRAILAEQFAPEERAFFEQTVRPIIESPQAVTTSRIAYLSARKPLATQSGGMIDSAILAMNR
ncbi:MAG TPA: methyltransferase domain-containing protein [Steroidobacteraceae bacterium]